MYGRYSVKLDTFARKAFNRHKAEVLWHRLNNWEVRRFDNKLGVDTAGVLEPTELTVRTGVAADGTAYVGTQPRLARWVLTELPHHRGAYTFVDMGSGKGRVLLFAAQAGFRRAVGVEFAEELHATAAANARIASEHGLSIEPVLGDAGTYGFPDEPLVVFFSNPFHEPVMVCVIANLTASYERRRRPVVVVYQQMTVEFPAHRTSNLALLDAVPFLTGRTLSPPKGAINRRFLAPFTVRIYESAEVVRPS